MTDRARHPPTTRRQALQAAGGLVLGASGAVRAQPASAPPGSDKGGPPPTPGTLLQVPAITLLDGRSFEPEQARGQVLVLYWWASWCPFCALQTPMMEKLWRAHRERGLRMLGLSIDRKAEDAVAYLAKRGYSFPSALVTPAFARALPKPKGLPVTVVRGRDDRVLMGEAGQLFAEDVEQIGRLL